MEFPAGFAWGVSTAAYQIEGAVGEGGRGESIWDRFSHSPGAVLHGDTGDVACDHYHRLDEDLDLLATLGVQVYRFSLAWPRIQPSGRGEANAAGIAFYDRLIDGLLARGIKPVPTLYHWDLPQALQDEGGWASRAIVDAFADYATVAFAAFGDRVDTWTTINEPWVATYFGYRIGIHAPGIKDPAVAAAAHHHMLLAHASAVERYRSTGAGGAIGIALNLMQVYPTSDHPDDVAAAALADAQLNTSFLMPLFTGGYPQALCALEPFWDEGRGIVQPGDLERLLGKTDFLSVNFYHPRYVCAPGRVTDARVAGFDGGLEAPMSFGLPMIDVQPARARKTLIGWIIEPAGFRDLLVRLGRDYPGVPLYISENGASYADYADQSGEVRDQERIAYLRDHIGACGEAIASGVDLRGYWLWSFMDNFEWSMGYSQRFGIVHVDYPTQNRTPKASFHWYRDTIRTNGLPET
ncbi:MAG: GH1 family beta-glucosidase [Janthinobacterium lividum]